MLVERTKDEITKALWEIDREADSLAAELEPVYKALDWKWATPKLHVPTKDEIALTIMSLCREVRDSVDTNDDNLWFGGFGGTYAATGGIEVGVKVPGRNSTLYHVYVRFTYGRTKYLSPKRSNKHVKA